MIVDRWQVDSFVPGGQSFTWNERNWTLKQEIRVMTEGPRRIQAAIEMNDDEERAQAPH